MRVSPKIFPVAVFLLVVGVSVGLFIFPELIYRLLFLIVESFRVGGPPLLFVAMIVQALAIPIPSEFVLICGGAAFGLLLGWLVGALGSVVAAFIGFYISRKGGRSVAIRFVGDRGIKFADNWFNRWGMWAVLLGRIAPFVPFDVISYSAGLTKMKFRSFIVPTVTGTLPRVFFYAFLGYCFSGSLNDLMQNYPNVPSELEGTMFMFNIILLTIVIVMALMLIVYWFVTRRYTARQETKSI
ncbi:MAG: SNARE associated Golgi protein [Candidatus Bathyarchaeota archaeon BA2]|nr:MAG: SNARE associated Golgi protein [Candidatus Bathyarchaeota archaeon BA2]